MAGWITIGKYHARVNLGKAWIHRKKVFPALGAGFVAYCVGLYLIFDSYKESIISLIGTPEGLEIVVFSAILSLIVLALWVYIIYINVLVGIRKRKRRDIQLLLSAPITYTDLLIGSFLAMLPMVAIAFTFLYAPIALIAAVVFESGLVAIVKIGIALGITVILALIISGIVLAIVEPIIDRLSRNRIALVVFIIIGVIGYSLFYTIPGEGIGKISDFVVYKYLPTTLAGNVINEALVGPLGFKPDPSGGMSMLLLALITLAVFYLGFTSAGRLFSLEGGIATPSVTIEKEGNLYRLLRRFGVGERVIFHSKVFFRNPKNIMQFGMMAAIVYVIPFFTLRSIPTEAGAEAELALMGILITVMMIAFLAPFPALSVYALSKDAMWVWKSAPDGERSFLLTKWKQSIIVGLVYIPVPIVTGYWSKSPWSYILLGMVLILIILASTTSIALFVSTYNPAYDVEGTKLALNLFLVIGIFIGIAVPPLYIIIGVLGLDWESFGLLLILGIGILANVIGAGLMRLAIGRLERQE